MADQIWQLENKRNAETCALGRNGWMAQIGISVRRTKYETAPGRIIDKVTIEPINSRNEVGRCEMQIPFSEVPLLIENLHKLLHEAQVEARTSLKRK